MPNSNHNNNITGRVIYHPDESDEGTFVICILRAGGGGGGLGCGGRGLGCEGRSLVFRASIYLNKGISRELCSSGERGMGGGGGRVSGSKLDKI